MVGSQSPGADRGMAPPEMGKSLALVSFKLPMVGGGMGVGKGEGLGYSPRVTAIRHPPIESTTFAPA